MRLAHGLMIRFVVIALVCLGAASAWVLVDIDRSLREDARRGALFVARQMELQISLRGAVHAGVSPFPVWKPVMDDGLAPGLCMRYRPAGDRVGPSFCKGGGWSDAVPGWFEVLYGSLFDPSRTTSLPVAFRGEVAGMVEIVAESKVTIATAWSRLRTVADVTTVTVVAATVLVFAAIGEALRPSCAVLAGLDRMADGDLGARLPAFRILEFRTIASAFNSLAERLQKAEAERSALTRRLFQVQEDERRHLARELHDEFGQNLAAIGALAASIEGERRDKTGQNGAEQDGAGNDDARAIVRVVGNMMESLRGALEQLRPPELDELGLAASLQGLITRWNSSASETCFSLHVRGELGDLPPAVTQSVYRIVQEGFTNAARHAEATAVEAWLIRRTADDGPGDALEIRIEDDGGPSSLQLPPEPGLGMLGIRERVAALGGHLSLQQTGQGFRLTAVLPDQLLEPAGGEAA